MWKWICINILRIPIHCELCKAGRYLECIQARDLKEIMRRPGYADATLKEIIAGQFDRPNGICNDPNIPLDRW
jgi:hypothetical protein